MTMLQLAADPSGPPAFLAPTAALVVAAALIGYVSVRARVVPIVGFLLAGVVIGPHQLGLIADQHTVEAAAEVGVILLLFTIGIEFSIERLNRIRRWILLGGGLQVVLTSALVVGVLALADVDWRQGLFTGFLVALSSTAIVLKLLGDAGETSSRRGQLALALLIFQDLAVVLMVLVVPLLGAKDGASGSGPADLAVALGTAVAIIAIVLVAARR
jgi:CPA2 family monovalent cation:H+ antiporter-2